MGGIGSLAHALRAWGALAVLAGCTLLYYGVSLPAYRTRFTLAAREHISVSVLDGMYHVDTVMPFEVIDSQFCSIDTAV